MPEPDFMPCTGLHTVCNKDRTYFRVCSSNQLDYMRSIGMLIVGEGT